MAQQGHENDRGDELPKQSSPRAANRLATGGHASQSRMAVTRAAARNSSIPSAGRMSARNREYERHLRDYVGKHTTTLFDNIDFRGTDDPVEAIHDLRVASRRLRALLEVFGPYISSKHMVRAMTLLKKVTRGAGDLREWDVHSQHLSEQLELSNSHLESAALEHVLENVDARRDLEDRKANRHLARLETDRLRRTLGRILDDLVETLSIADLSLVAWNALEPCIYDVFQELPEPEAGDSGEKLHTVRIRVKKLRYAVELLKPIIGDRYALIHRRLKHFQEFLGRHHDLFVLHELLLEFRDALDVKDRAHLVMGLAVPIHRLASEQNRITAEFLEECRQFDRHAFLQQVEVALEESRAPRALLPGGDDHED